VTRVALFAVLLALIGGAAAGVGALVGNGSAASRATAGGDMAMSAGANGLASTADGYSFVPEATVLRRGSNLFRFRILDDAGHPARRFDLDGGVRLHLLLARRDLTQYQHLHPTLHADGSWTIPIVISEPGVYRAFADFEVDGKKTVLGRDLFVAGDFRAAAAPATTATSTAGPYRVRIARGVLHAGQEAPIAFVVTRGGRPVESFQEYVGARGHLVALHVGDLAYAHVHPSDAGGSGRIDFRAELTEPGRYRLFLQFKRDGRVYTAPFAVEVAR
jgi:hypothetical protein